MRERRRRRASAARRTHGPEHVQRRALERWGLVLTRDDVRNLEALIRAARAGDPSAPAHLLEEQSPDRERWAVRFAGMGREVAFDPTRGRLRSVGWTWPLELEELGAVEAAARPAVSAEGEAA